MSNDTQGREANLPFDLERAPLERPRGFDTDWGGDGSDLTRPVRAHVLAALPPSAGPYQPPLDAILTLGEVDDEELERRREELGIGQEHVPELVRILRDRALNTADSDTPEVWAPIHALHLLANLDLSAAVSDLIPLFDCGNRAAAALAYDARRRVGERRGYAARDAGPGAMRPLQRLAAFTAPESQHQHLHPNHW